MRCAQPPWTVAAVVVLGEALLSLVGVRAPALSALALLAPGFALIPLLPRRVRERTLTACMAAPALGIATVSVVLITLARVGVTLSGLSIRVALIALVAVALPTWRRSDAPAGAAAGVGPLEAIGLLIAFIAGAVLALRVLGTGTPTGNDWAKYLLYAEQIARHGSLLIRNPFWMLGQPFRDDPGVPSLYGSILIMAHAQAGVLVHGILAFDLLQIATVYAFARAFGGPVAGVVAALLIAVVPVSQDILGWYGLANLAALVLLALQMAYLAAFATRADVSEGQEAADGGGLDGRERVGMALTLLGLLAAHRLLGLVGAALATVVVVGCLVSPARRRRALRDGAVVAALAALGGAGVMADLIARERTFGGSLPYTDYLATKIDLVLAEHDLSLLLVAATALALVAVGARRRLRDVALAGPIALLAADVALTFAWIAHVPNYYTRMVYDVPVAAAPLLGIVAARMSTCLRTRPPRLARLLVAAGAIAIALTAVGAYRETASIRSYYSFATPASLRGLDALSATLRPDEVVVTDRCWSFLATWLLHTRTLAALEPQDIEPAAELPFAREAQAIIDGTPHGRAIARRLGVRYMLVNPICPGPNGKTLPAPGQGRVVYESVRLAIFRLPSAR